MNTKFILTISALLLGTAGTFLIFFPAEALGYTAVDLSQLSGLAISTLVYLLQLLGALYFAFALLNWMARQSLVGGIYNRPIAMANFVHFFIAGICLIKMVFGDAGLPLASTVTAVIYLVFALLFALILFRHPGQA